MNCFFCKKSLTSDLFQSPKVIDAPITYICNSHPVKVCHRIQVLVDRTDFVYFSYIYNDYTYSLYFYSNKSFEVVAFPKGKDSLNSVMKLDFHPDITPENVAEKLPILIVFS